MIQIKKAKEIKDRALRILIYGESGAGKTTLLKTAPRPILVIDFEAGADIICAGEDDIDIVFVSDMKMLREVLLFLKGQTKYKTIAFDGFSIFTQKMLFDILQERNKDNPTWFEWGLLTNRVKEVVLSLLRPNTHIVFTALLKRKVENNKLVAMYPDLPQSLRQYLMAVMDLMGIIYVDNEGIRKLSFISDKKIAEVKDRSGKLKVEEPNLSLIIKKVLGGES